MGGRGSKSGMTIGYTAMPDTDDDVISPDTDDTTSADFIDQNKLMAMNDFEFMDFLRDLSNVDMPMFMPNWDTQKAIYAMQLNGLPDVVDDKTFNSLPGTTMYRTVNSQYDAATDVNMNANDVAQQLMYGRLSRIGGGYYGDGYYFANNKADSLSYGNTRGNIQKTAVMKMKLNSKARVITDTQLRRMLSQESRSVQAMIKRLSSGKNGQGGELAVYALRKGYNVIHDGWSYYNVIDRSVMTMSKVVSPK